MITEQPENWGTPLGDWFDSLPKIEDKPVTVKVITPAGLVNMTPEKFRTATVLGLSVRSEDE